VTVRAGSISLTLSTIIADADDITEVHFCYRRNWPAGAWSCDIELPSFDVEHL
jgi:hypothetical protein